MFGVWRVAVQHLAVVEVRSEQVEVRICLYRAEDRDPTPAEVADANRSRTRLSSWRNHTGHKGSFITELQGITGVLDQRSLAGAVSSSEKRRRGGGGSGSYRGMPVEFNRVVVAVEYPPVGAGAAVLPYGVKPIFLIAEGAGQRHVDGVAQAGVDLGGES